MTYMGVGGWQALGLHGDCLPQSDCSELCTGQEHTKKCADLSNSKNMVFNGKKLLIDGVDLTHPQAKGWKEAMLAE
jgi:hypothetical protein